MTMRLLPLKAQSMVCKIQAIGLGFFVVCQAAIAQPATSKTGVAHPVPVYPTTVLEGDSVEVGDIPFDPLIDDPSFRICDSRRVFQYYNTGSWYLDHKKEIGRYFIRQY